MYCNGALNLIDSFDSPSAPPSAFDFVTIDISVNPPTELPTLNTEAPFASSLFVIIYSNITILPSANLFPKIPSPK